MRRSRGQRGATLVELMVVLAIVVFLMTILGFGVSQTYQSSLAEVSAIEQRAIAFEQERAGLSQTSFVPSIEAASVDITLDATPVIDGLSVHSEYQMVLTGKYTLHNPDPEPRTVALAFPFSGGGSLVSDVSLSIAYDGQTPFSPPDARYGDGQIRWMGELAPGQSIDVEIHYATVGRDSLSIAFPPGSQPIDIDVTLHKTPEVALVAAEGSLPPTQTGEEQWRWSMSDTVSPRAISVSLPARQTAPGRLAALVQISLLGLVVFFAGLWYTSEGTRPGRADEIHLGGLLLLALDYMAFYVLFVLVAHATTPLWGLLCALLSLPLLSLHLSALASRRFALQIAAPLALVTQLSALGLAYAGDRAPWLWLALLGAAITFVTATFRPWVDRRERCRIALAEQRAREEDAAKIVAAEQRLEGILAQQDRSLVSAREQLRAQVYEGPARSRAERALAEVERQIASGRLLQVALREGRADGELIDEICASLARAKGHLDSSLAEVAQTARSSREAHDSAVVAMREALEDLGVALVSARQAAAHAPASHRAEIEAEIEAGRGLQEIARGLQIDRESVRAVASLAESARSQRHRLVDRCERSASALKIARAPKLHCPSCGGEHTATSRFCPSCGVVRPSALSCPVCAATGLYPQHLMGLGWQSQLRCYGCGAPIGASEDLEHPRAP